MVYRPERRKQAAIFAVGVTASRLGPPGSWLYSEGMKQPFDEASRYQKLLPPRIRRYLNSRGIPDRSIARFRLGWNGRRITIPIYNRRGEFLHFRLARDPGASRPEPKMLSTPGSHAELYGWERAEEKPLQLVVCEGEFDRLVLESLGVPAVTSTGGAGVFHPLWAAHLVDVPYIYACFDLDEAGVLGAQRVAALLPQTRIVRLPGELGRGGDVTDYFAGLGRTVEDFRRLMERAQPLDPRELARARRPMSPLRSAPAADEVAMVKAHTSIEYIVNTYVQLRRSGRSFIGRCPFHADRTPSFVVFTETQSYHCFGCKATGDVIGFLMRREDMSFNEALCALKSLSGI